MCEEKAAGSLLCERHCSKYAPVWGSRASITGRRRIRIVLDRDVQGALDFMKMIDKRCEHIITRQGSLKNAIDT